MSRFNIKLTLRLVAVIAGLAVAAMLVGTGASTNEGASEAKPNDVTASLPSGNSGLPLPRFVSLKSDRVNVRQGPSREHAIAWVYTRQGLPVEIVAEYDNWRQIRDADGEEGWVFHSLLSGRRTVLVAPWEKTGELTLRATPEVGGQVTARLEPGVLGSLEICTDSWCRVEIDSYRGWIGQNQLWGVYPDEAIK